MLEGLDARMLGRCCLLIAVSYPRILVFLYSSYYNHTKGDCCSRKALAGEAVGCLLRTSHNAANAVISLCPKGKI